MSYTDYIWDLGGTLLDNYQTSALAFQHVLREDFNVDVGFEAIYDALRVSTEFAVDKFAADLPGFIQLYKTREVADLRSPILFPGAIAVLDAIVKQGHRNFMISHRDDHVIEILKAANISQYFTEVVTASNGFDRKPGPQSIQYLLDKYQLKQAVMIGDRNIDMLAGEAAHIDTIYFNTVDDQTNVTHKITCLTDILSL